MFEATPQHDDLHDAFPAGLPESIRKNPSDVGLQRAQGAGRVVLSGSMNGTRVSDVHQRFPIRIMFPQIGDGVVREAVIVNASGGIAGGDRLELEVIALNKASVVVTSQAAEKVYRALDRPARIATRLKAHEAARLAWLPQETILFDRARIYRRTEVDLCSGAELMALEWLVLGRAARGEEMVSGHIADTWRVRRDGRLIWADGFHVADEVFAQLHRKALLANCRAVGTLIYFGPAHEARLQVLREIAPSLECQCAATAVGALIIVRFAAGAGSDLRRGLGILLEQFGRELGRGPFRVPKMWSC
ncbi:urease accessory protein UreD [Bradyrhizobium sp.]